MPARALLPAHQLSRRAALARVLASRARAAPPRAAIAVFEVVGVVAMIGVFMAIAILA